MGWLGLFNIGFNRRVQ